MNNVPLFGNLVIALRILSICKLFPISKLSRQFINVPSRLLLGRHGSDSLCRVERKNKMADTYNVLVFKL